MKRTVQSIILAALLFVPAALRAQSFDPARAGLSLLKVVAYDDDEILREETGIVVDVGGMVLANAHVADRSDRLTVISLVTGAELVAELAVEDEDLDLAILKVDGLDAPPMFFSVRPAGEADAVHSLGNWDGSGPSAGALSIDLARGSVGSLVDLEIEDGRLAPFLIHNAMVPRQGYGGPIVNACGEILGVNRPDPALSNRRVRRGADPEQAVHALSAAAVREFLAASGLQPAVATEKCLTEVERAALSTEQAEAEKERAQEAAEAARQAAEEAQRRAEELERTAREAQQQAEMSAEDKRRAQEAARRAREEAQRKAIEARELEAKATQLERRIREAEQAAAEARRAEAESRRRLYIGLGVAGGALLILIVIAAVMIRKRSKKASAAEDEAEAAKVEAAMARAEAKAAVPKTWNNCLLEGAPVSLKLPGSAMPADVGGATVGRHPAHATVVFDDPAISRSHARFYADGDEVYVEDLGSTNGTKVGGEPLEANKARRINDGDKITLGPHEFKFRILT